MTYINVGAHVGEHGLRPTTKRALKDAITRDGALVTFETTSALEPMSQIVLPGVTTAEVLAFTGARELRAGEKLSVVGPDPYTSRKWYATVELVGGKVKVS